MAPLDAIEQHQDLDPLARDVEHEETLGLGRRGVDEGADLGHLAPSAPAPQREVGTILVGGRSGQDQDAVGERREIADAMRSIVAAHSGTGGTIEDLADLLTPELISEHLYTSGQPDPDLIIRTSGEQRISDFMLWQSAHSELYFVEALGPDLREVDLLRALRDYGTRHRRFGQ